MARTAFVLGSNGPSALAGLRPLQFAESDAQRFANLLKYSEIEFNIATIKSRTKNGIFREFTETISELSYNDEFIFYFAGHGIVSRGDLYLTLDETKPGARLADTALPWVNIRQVIKHANVNNNIVILDCCHAGEAVDDALGSAFRGGLDQEALGHVLRGSVASILVACGPDARARESPRRGGGIMTSLMIAGVNSLLKHGDEPLVTLEGLRDWMWDEIDRADDLKGLRSDERPLLSASGGRTFYFNKPALNKTKAVENRTNMRSAVSFVDPLTEIDKAAPMFAGSESEKYSIAVEAKNSLHAKSFRLSGVSTQSEEFWDNFKRPLSIGELSHEDPKNWEYRWGFGALFLAALIMVLISSLDTVSFSNTSRRTYEKVICTGEKEDKCPGSHDIFKVCGYYGSDEEEARAACGGTLSYATRIKTVDGNRCGYALIQATCNL